MSGTLAEMELKPLDGSSTLRDKNGIVRAFGADGWLRSLTDRTGNTVTIVRGRRKGDRLLF